MRVRFLLLVLVLITTSCRRGDLRPTAIDKDDVCTACKMAISQMRYAGQIVDRDGSRKFDDIGCMVKYINKNKIREIEGEIAFFVADYEDGKTWVRVRKAVFVKSGRIDSPMASGIGAFRDKESANRFIQKNGGEVIQIDRLLSGPTA